MYHYEFKRNRLQSWRQNNDLAIKEVANSSSVAEQSHFQPSFIPGCHPPARAASCKVRCCHGSRHPEERLRALPRAEGIRMDRYSHSDEKQTCFLSCPLASFPAIHWWLAFPWASRAASVTTRKKAASTLSPRCLCLVRYTKLHHTAPFQEINSLLKSEAKALPRRALSAAGTGRLEAGLGHRPKCQPCKGKHHIRTLLKNML